MTTKTQTAVVDESKLILELRIDTQGFVHRTNSSAEKKDTLEGTLLSQVYPGIRVARVSVPAESTPYEQAVVENTMATLQWDGVEYRLIGASGAAKEGRFYFVDAAHAPAIAERFQHWPEAAIVYFSIMVTDCKVVIDEPYTRVLVVKDSFLAPMTAVGGFGSRSTKSSTWRRIVSSSFGWRSIRVNRSRPRVLSRR